MSRYSLSPDRLFDRPWRSGHPFRPRCGRARRVVMMILLIILCLVIGGYNYVTDSERVRQMAESSLSGLIGGRVQVGGATLSIFEGLRLDDVKVYVDRTPPATRPGGGADARVDSLIFSARTFVIQYSPRSMLKGNLEATQIVAEKPHVHLTQDVTSGAWNFHRLGAEERDRPQAPGGEAKPRKTPVLPELLLRNARVELSELRDGKKQIVGFMAIDGQITPEAGGERYGFVLQSRGLSDAMGPLVSGSVHLGTGQVAATLKQFEFGRDVRSMLPADVREWWERHELAGRVDIPVLNYTPPRAGLRARFTVETILNGVNLAVPPEELMAGAEVARRQDARAALEIMRTAHEVAGIDLPDPGPRNPVSPFGEWLRGGEEQLWPDTIWPDAVWPEVGPEVPAVGAGQAAPTPWTPPDPRLLHPQTPHRTPVDPLLRLLESTPTRLTHVAGSFLFTEDGIEVRQVSGRLENNAFKVTGRIHGYEPDARVSLRLTSLETEDLMIPASPRYIWSLPAPAREFYEQFRPQGTLRISADVRRDDIGGPIHASGHVDVVDCSFMFDEFPYPLRHASGRVAFGRDAVNGWEWVSISNLRGQGPAGGPNADAMITVDGWVGPINPGTPEIGANLRIRGQNLQSEPLLTAAFGRDVRDAMKKFDAAGKGEFPKFKGSVVANIARPIGPGEWTYNLDIHLEEASGAMVGFPYPLRNVKGDVRIREGYIDIIGMSMKHGPGTIVADGRISSDDDDEAAARATDLRITGRDLPIDEDLLSALEPDQQEWIRKAGLRGTLDVDGRIGGLPPGAASALRGPEEDLHYDFTIAVRDATVKPHGGEFEIADVAGKLKLTPDRLELTDLRGRRGKAALAARGAVLFPEEGTQAKPHLVLKATGTEVLLEPSLYAILPADARLAWEELHPVGTLDATITYSGTVGGDAEAPAPAAALRPVAGGAMAVDLTREPARPATQPASSLPLALARAMPDLAGLAPGLNATLRPRELSATMKSLPYRLDNLGGTVHVTPEKATLEKVTARRGDARFSVSGTGVFGERSLWDLSITATGLKADEELRKALPPAMAAGLESLELKGTLGLNLSRFIYRGAPTPAEPPGASAPGVAAAAAHSPPPAPPATGPAPGPDIFFAGALSLHGAALDVGVPLREVNGALAIEAAVFRDGRLERLAGNIDIDNLQLAGRPMKNLRATVVKSPGKGDLTIGHMHATVAGGDLAGAVNLLYPDDGPGRYHIDLKIRNTDVKELTMDPQQDLSGRLTASLLLEGAWGKADTRRGRGDVVMSGREMYRIPLILGLLQITNLALPISSPFKNATARYSVNGDSLNFENIELRSDHMVMSGEGSLDFGTRKVDMTFITDSAGGFRVPFLEGIWKGAQQELLRIHVRGTVQEPKVQAGVLGTFTTTIDQVFRGDPPRGAKRR